MSRPRMFDDAKAEQIREWYEKWCAIPTCKAMAVQMGCSASTLLNYCKSQHEAVAFRNKVKDYGIDKLPPDKPT